MMVTDTILVTGATGFIGSHMAKSLAERGKRVRCLVRRSSPHAAVTFLSSLGAELVYGDLTDPESLRKAVESVNGVFHLGGGGRVDTSEDLCYRINADGTRNILEACLRQGGVRKLVHVSTCGVMGDIKNPPADETRPYNPENMAYARTKAQAEKVALSYKDKLPVVVIRFPGVYGKPLIAGGVDRVEGVTPMSMIFSAVKKRQWAYIGDGQSLTHWVHVEDVVQGLELAAKKGKAGEVYILADEQPVTMEAMIKTVAKHLKVEPPTRHIPIPVAFALALAFEAWARIFGGTPRLSRVLVRGFLANRAFDISKARRELGYQPKFGLEEGMRETVRWYEAEGYL
ncbi:MAG: SDR family NAD(P)-dependent oxidoreductase [Chloroflexi bacterium]|nr:SDR family NAD(P)-dependent oxidoreductase [Chloroflexota bacterium]